MNVQPVDAPAARPVCEQCGTRPAIPGVRFCLACLDRQVLEHQAKLAGSRG